MLSSGLPLLLSIAFAHLRMRVRQTLAALLGVTVGVGFFLATSAMMVGSQADFIRTLIDTAPHIIVQDELRASPPQPAVEKYSDAVVEVHGLHARDELRGLKDWSAMLADIRAVPGSVATPALSGGVALRFAGHTEAVQLSGIDPRIEDEVTDIAEDMIGGRLGDLENVQNGIVISTRTATRLGAMIGDTVIVSSSAGVIQRSKIVALVNSDVRAGAEAFAFTMLRTAQVLFARPNIVNQLHVKLSDPSAAQSIATALEARWGYKWQSWQERSKDILDALLIRNVIMYAVISAILLVASFGVYTVISTNVADKRRDIAILRAIGFAERDITSIFVIEGVALGLVGALAGFALGYGLMAALGSVPFKMQGQTFYIPLDRSWRQYAIAGGVSLCSAVVAAWLPARRAASLNPVDILRGAA
jgi:lipoprotein-releasing system permease protein